MGTDATMAERARQPEEIHARARAIELLQAEGVPFLVGGAYCYACYTGIYRDTKDLDLFPRKVDAVRALEVLERDGWRTERTDEVWIYKAFKGEYFVDFIFSSGNGVAVVDDEWFAHACTGTVFGHPVQIAPPEEMIWSKAFVLERERFDGSDVNHLLRATGGRMDWDRLMRRFERHWEVLLAHLMLFRFAYPSDREQVPGWVMAELLRRTGQSVREGDWEERVCRGNLLSKVNYGVDLTEWGYADGRRWDEVRRGGGGDQAHGDHDQEGGPRGEGHIEAADSGGR
jgi:hypothetical protein